MNLLVDTQAFIWMFTDPKRLTKEAYAAMRDGDVLLSVASPWEMTIKYSIGKLRIDVAPDIIVSQHIRRGILRLLPIELEHIAALRTLPPYHRDPFDRIIIAQALAENLTVVGSDGAFDAYGVRRVWE